MSGSVVKETINNTPFEFQGWLTKEMLSTKKICVQGENFEPVHSGKLPRSNILHIGVGL
jgi:hypothetical protein